MPCRSARCRSRVMTGRRRCGNWDDLRRPREGGDPSPLALLMAYGRCNAIAEHQRHGVCVLASRGRPRGNLDYQVRKVAPFRIISFDKPNLPVPIPLLQLFLARDRLIGTIEALDDTR